VNDRFGLVFVSDVLRQRVMVAEYVARQGGSPVNGETPSMPANGIVRNGGLYGAPPGPQGPQGPPQSQPCQGPQSRAQSPDTNSYPQRKQREFIPDNKKDESYWDRRRRNNEAAKRSREKRRFNDMILEQRVIELTKENHVLKAQLTAIRDRYGISGDSLLSMEHVLATLPSNDQMLGQAKRPKLSATPSGPPPTPTPPPSAAPPSAGPVPTSVIHQPVSALRSPPPQAFEEQPPPPPPHFYLHPEPEYPYLYDCPSAAALNLSRGCRSEASERAASPYEMSAGSGDEAVVSCHPAGAGAGANNCLPHKLRHKSHLGEKEAAGALLSLQTIKTESARASPPWDGEGSSDERDSGISLGVEWPAGPHSHSHNHSGSESSPPAVGSAASSAASTSPASVTAQHSPTPPSAGSVSGPAPPSAAPQPPSQQFALEEQMAQLASEVASIKNLMLKSKGSALGSALHLPVQLALPRQLHLPAMPPLPPLQQPHVALM